MKHLSVILLDTAACTADVIFIYLFNFRESGKDARVLYSYLAVSNCNTRISYPVSLNAPKIILLVLLAETEKN